MISSSFAFSRLSSCVIAKESIRSGYLRGMWATALACCLHFEELRSGVTQMNIVDVIKSQLSGEVIAKLSSLVGESEDKTKAAVVGAAVPGLLSVLASLATSGGADKLINALKQVDTGTGGGFGDVLSGQAGQVAEKGGSLLNIL